MSRSHPTAVVTALVAAVLATAGSCSSGPPGTPEASTGTPTGASSSGTSSGPFSSPAAPPATTARTSAAGRSCAEQVAAALTEEQAVGQLLMVGLTPADGEAGLDGLIEQQHVGGVVYLGGWSGADSVTSASEHLRERSTESATGGIAPLVAADQEGGQVQQLQGAGFSDLPSALVQGGWRPATLERRAAAWGRELAAAGVNVNLAPVADVVPTSLGRANGPIGRWDRQFGSSPSEVGQHVTAFQRGMSAAKVAATVKHFPGIGRLRGNTDTTSIGITDSVTTGTDPALRPFRAAVDADVDLVMVSSGRYPRLDADTRATFSRPIISGLLRQRLGFDGVVITDDVGAAEALEGVPVGTRATRFLAAGGDVVLTADHGTVAPMLQAVRARMDSDRAFAAGIRASLRRVLELKDDLGLLPCSVRR